MDLRRAIGEYVTHGRELLTRLRSPKEGPTVTAVDLQILRVQLFLLDHEAANRQQMNTLSAPLEAASVLRKELSPPPND